MMPERIGAGMTLLIVDDDLDLLPNLTTTMQMLTDFRVIVANNGADALTRLYEIRPQCVIVDVKMPLVDGYQFVRALRGDPETAAIPIIILTAMTQEIERFQGLASGADRYLLKPAKVLDLVNAIREVLALSEAERSSRQITLAEGDEPSS
jgi:DNA-binding response OmpR family regulator